MRGTINILGMTVRMERERGRAVINQKRLVDNLISTYGVTKTAITPDTGDLMFVREDSKLMEDQRKFMSLNATLMFTRQRGHTRRFCLLWFTYRHVITRLRMTTTLRL